MTVTIQRAPAASTCGTNFQRARVPYKLPKPMDAKTKEPPQQTEAMRPVPILAASGLALSAFIASYVCLANPRLVTKLNAYAVQKAGPEVGGRR